MKAYMVTLGEALPAGAQVLVRVEDDGKVYGDTRHGAYDVWTPVEITRGAVEVRS